ncbi:putative 50s ribosomal protein l13 [Diplodia seriata]|uniref:Putative 50s ribosomal protein l13 n=1 Tax=Diplodia seriata TaxID=420778 RepID=A0A0G2GBD5_9PEZI|nr:putative 50s ribosomal protein l13 [Diplodia seriata]
MSQTIGKTRLAYSRAWHHIDCSLDARPLGRLASSIALALMGKHKPIFDPSTDCGDYVVATNCGQLRTTGKKLFRKKYYRHTTRPGSLQEITMQRLMEKWGGGEILPFEGAAHPYKKNILKVAGQEASSIRELPEVKKAFAGSE